LNNAQIGRSKKSGQLTCYETGQFYLLPTMRRH
jgi:hypothetical protein